MAKTKHSGAPDELVKVGQAAKLLSCSTESVRRWLAAGVLRGQVSPTTGHRLVSLRSIQALLDKCNKS